MRSVSILSCLLMIPSVVEGFSAARRFTASSSCQSSTTVQLRMTSTPTDEDPCWQDLYDDDCAMESVNHAYFVAGKWIKSMPCANGLDEDCDMGTLDSPEGRPEAGVDQVDVMAFLKLKKAESLSKKGESDLAP